MLRVDMDKDQLKTLALQKSKALHWQNLALANRNGDFPPGVKVCQYYGMEIFTK